MHFEVIAKVEATCRQRGIKTHHGEVYDHRKNILFLRRNWPRRSSSAKLEVEMRRNKATVAFTAAFALHSMSWRAYPWLESIERDFHTLEHRSVEGAGFFTTVAAPGCCHCRRLATDRAVNRLYSIDVATQTRYKHLPRIHPEDVLIRGSSSVSIDSREPVAVNGVQRLRRSLGKGKCKIKR